MRDTETAFVIVSLTVFKQQHEKLLNGSIGCFILLNSVTEDGLS